MYQEKGGKIWKFSKKIKNSPIDKSHKQLKIIQIVGAKNGEKNKQGSENNIYFTHVLKVAKWK